MKDDRVSGFFVGGFVSSMRLPFSLLTCMAYIEVRGGELEGNEVREGVKKRELRVE